MCLCNKKRHNSYLGRNRQQYWCHRSKSSKKWQTHVTSLAAGPAEHKGNGPNQKYSRLRCLLRVKDLEICFYLGCSGSILQIRINIIKVGSKSWLLTCSSSSISANSFLPWKISPFNSFRSNYSIYEVKNCRNVETMKIFTFYTFKKE